MEQIKDTVRSVFEKLATQKKEPAQANPANWLKKSLTKKELRHIKCDYFRKGVLGLSVDSSSWLYYFNLKKTEILARLVKQSNDIKDAHFYLGDIE